MKLVSGAVWGFTNGTIQNGCIISIGALCGSMLNSVKGVGRG